VVTFSDKRAIRFAHLLVKFRVASSVSEVAFGDRRASEPIDEACHIHVDRVRKLPLLTNR